MQPVEVARSEALLGSTPNPRARRAVGLLVVGLVVVCICFTVSSGAGAFWQCLTVKKEAPSLARSPVGRPGSAVRMVAERVALPTDNAKALHALGFDIGANQLYDIKGLDEAEIDYILSGVKASMMGEAPGVSLPEYVPKGAEILDAKMMEMVQGMEAKGREVLKAAAKEKGAKQTASGLVFRSVVEGKGKSPKRETDTVEVHYEGTLVDGTVFDSSYARGEPISFPLDRVIPGWTEGLMLMKAGGKAVLTLPPEIAYGEAGSGPAIPPQSTLIFTVELLAVK